MKEKSDIRELLALAKSQLKILILAIFALLMSSGLGLSFPALIGQMIDQLQDKNTQSLNMINDYVTLLFLLFFLMGIATFFRAYLFTLAGERIVADLRNDLFSKICRQEIAFFDQNKTGALTNRLASDTTVLQNAVSVNISMALRFTLSGLGSIIILLYTSWKLTLVMLSIVPIVAVAATIYGRKLRRVSKDVQDSLAEATSVAEEGLGNIRTVRAFAREDFESKRYEKAVEESFQLAKYRAFLGGSFAGLLSFVGYAAICGVLWYGGTMVIDGEIGFGTLTSFMLYTFTVAFSISALSGIYGDLAKAIGASERVFSLLKRENQLHDEGLKIPDMKGKLVFESVVFSYPTRPELKVLDNISIEIPVGKSVALVGASGGGKSTIAALTCRMYDPQEGTIYIDGVPIHSLSKNWLREQIAIVSQEPILFGGSIIENIRYGNLQASDDEVYVAARAANADHFIAQFPEGYHTLVGERGVRLSGGQKQRIAIARALLKDPKILLLDEATSALDSESETLVQEALEHLMKGRSTLVIAHRLSTIQNTDSIAVLEDGKIVEEGSHAVLLNRSGRYAALIQHQYIEKEI